jgi:hypothetical protein
MSAVEGADAEMDDADAGVAAHVVWPRDRVRERGECGFVQVRCGVGHRAGISRRVFDVPIAFPFSLREKVARSAG